jgi:hypothetical protein
MVEENETQQTITPQIAVENVLAGLRLLEQAFEAIGPKGRSRNLKSGWVG